MCNGKLSHVLLCEKWCSNIANALRSMQVQFLSTVEQMVTGDSPTRPKMWSPCKWLMKMIDPP